MSAPVKGSEWFVWLKITPNFSFAWMPASYEEGGDTVIGVSFWEQRNAAVVVRVLEGGRKE